jgi:glutathione S-transferase
MQRHLTLVIGNKNYSSWSLRPWLLLRQFGVPFEELKLPLDEPEFYARIGDYSPAGRVPVLIERATDTADAPGTAKHADGRPADAAGAGQSVESISRETHVWDSLAICEYANECVLDGRGWPADRAARAHARSISAEMHSGFGALRTALPMNTHRHGPTPALGADVIRDIERIKAIWREARERHAARGDFLFGSFCIADAMYAPVVLRFESYSIGLGPAERAYADTLLALPALREWLIEAATEPLASLHERDTP